MQMIHRLFSGKFVRLLALSLFAYAGLFLHLAHGQNSVPVTLVVGFPPGGTTDVLARKLVNELGDNLGRSVLVSNQSGDLGLTATHNFQNATPNGVQFLLVRVSSLNASDMASYGGVHPIIASSNLQSLVPVASIGYSPQAAGYTWYGVFAPPNTPSAYVLPFQAAVARTLTAPSVRAAFDALKITPADGYIPAMAAWVAQSQTSNLPLAQPATTAVPATMQMPLQSSVQTQTASLPQNTAATASRNVDDTVQTGHSDAPLSTEATGKIDISASLNSERTKYAPAQMPQGLNPTNLNVYNDLPTIMMGMRINNILERAKNAQTAVDQDRRGGPKRHFVSAAAHQCLKLIKEPRMYGGFTNTCSFAVEYNFCLYRPEKDSWGEMFDCEKGNGSGGSWQVGPLKNVAAHTNGAERVHWFACRWGETLGKPDGVSPADVYFDRGSRRMMGRCSSWGRETERYDSASGSGTASNTASANQQGQPSAQRPTGAVQQSNSASTSASTTSTQAGTGKGTSSQQLAGGTGKWPAGVEPGNLYIVRHRLTTDAFSVDELMLISARSKAEAEQQYERAYNVFRDEALKPFQAQGGTAGRANLAFHGPRYKMDYQVTQECLGANWGAVVAVNDNRQLGNGAACGAKTPAEAITAAFEVCSRKGYNCNREGSRSPTPIITIAHSGARPWVEPIDKPRVGSSWPPVTFQFTALSATTYQISASTIDYVQGPNEAIASFGKACGKKAHPRDIYSCWITTRIMPCILNSPINPQDKMPMQQTCVDMKLTKDGYLP